MRGQQLDSWRQSWGYFVRSSHELARSLNSLKFSWRSLAIPTVAVYSTRPPFERPFAGGVAELPHFLGQALQINLAGRQSSRLLQPASERSVEDALPVLMKVEVGLPEVCSVLDGQRPGTRQQVGGVEHRRIETGSSDEHENIAAKPIEPI